tara:strand:- start:76 stop:279 length:204 start_codon:yes stop_codon:yes gene_type:complete
VLKGSGQREQDLDVAEICQHLTLDANVLCLQRVGQLLGIALRVNQVVIGAGQQQCGRTLCAGVDQRL